MGATLAVSLRTDSKSHARGESDLVIGQAVRVGQDPQAEAMGFLDDGPRRGLRDRPERPLGVALVHDGELHVVHPGLGHAQDGAAGLGLVAAGEDHAHPPEHRGHPVERVAFGRGQDRPRGHERRASERVAGRVRAQRADERRGAAHVAGGGDPGGQGALEVADDLGDAGALQRVEGAAADEVGVGVHETGHHQGASRVEAAPKGKPRSLEPLDPACAQDDVDRPGREARAVKEEIRADHEIGGFTEASLRRGAVRAPPLVPVAGVTAPAAAHVATGRTGLKPATAKW